MLIETALSVRANSKGIITKEVWEHLLECFMIKKEAKQNNRTPPHEDAYAKMIELFRLRKILPDGLWV